MKLLSYLFPAVTVFLLSLFFLNVPDLRHSRIKTADSGKMSSAEILALFAITAVYAAVAFFNLGKTSSPQSFVKFSSGEQAVIELEESADISGFRIYTGINIGSYQIETSTDGTDYLISASFTQDYTSLLKWHDLEAAGENVKYVRVTATGNVWLGELAVLDENRQTVPLKAAGTGAALADEQELVPAYSTYLNSTYFDEIYHVRTAVEHLNDIKPYEISHPPLGKILIGIGIRLFGLTPFGWRFMGTLFGVFMLPAMYILLKKMFSGMLVPVCGTVLLATDFMHYVQTRIATIDSFSVFFILLMYLFMYLYITEDRKRWLALSGIFFGFGAATKWICLYAGAGLGIIWAARWVIEFIKNRESAGQILAGFFKNCLFCVCFFVIIPGIIYYLSYYYYGTAAGLKGPGMLFSKEYLSIVLENQKSMFSYHSGVNATHPYSSRWYQWVLNIRPILYYLQYYSDGTRSSFGAYVNPALCWGGLIAILMLIYVAVRHRDRKAAFIVTGYLAQLVPWMFVDRILFEYHYFACTLFLVMALSYIFALVRDNMPRGRYLAASYAALSFILFAAFYPTLSGFRVDSTSASALLAWLPTWPF